MNNRILFILLLAFSSTYINANNINTIKIEQSKFESYLIKQGLNSKNYNINQKEVDYIVKNTFLMESDIFEFMKKRILNKRNINLSNYSTLIAIAQSVRINLSKEDLNNLKEISKRLS